jgi:hypothetical protein
MAEITEAELEELRRDGIHILKPEAVRRTPVQPQDLPDFRSRGLPDQPFSAYCQVCWHTIYTLWISRQPHGGVCMHGCNKSQDCPEAAARDRNAARFAKLRALGLLTSGAG